MRDNNNNTRESQEERSRSLKQQPQVPMSLKLIDSCLRLSVVPLSVATIWLTVTNHESNPDYGNLDYNSIMGLKYMVGVSAISALYAFLSTVSSWVTCLVSKAWLFFIPDQVLAYVMTTSVAGATEIVYLLNKGDKRVTWSEMCSTYPHYCSKLTIALGLHVFVLFFFLFLSVISAYRAFSPFDPPASSESQSNVNA